MSHDISNKECDYGKVTEGFIDDNCFCPPQPDTQGWEEDFHDFYWEQGKYKGRKLGYKQYIAFITNLLPHHEKGGEHDPICWYSRHPAVKSVKGITCTCSSPADTEGWRNSFMDIFVELHSFNDPVYGKENKVVFEKYCYFIRSLIHSAEERGRQGRIKEEKIIFDALVDTALSQREDEIYREAEEESRTFECEGLGGIYETDPAIFLSDLRTLLQDKPMSSSETPQTP